METKKILRKIKNDGYCVIGNIFSNKECLNYKESLIKIQNKLKKNKYFKGEADDKGQVVIRDLVLRDPSTFLSTINKKIINKTLYKIFNDQFILDNCMASNSVKTNKYGTGYTVHIDSHLPAEKFNNTTDVVILICLDDFSKENGSTKIWPRSHLSGIRAQNIKLNQKKLKKIKNIKAKKGSIVFFLGHLWHQIGKNENSLDRWGILCHYKRWWIKPSTDFTKCGKKIFKMLTEDQKRIFGFNSISPKFNFKKKSRPLKTLRKMSLKNLNYKQILNY